MGVLLTILAWLLGILAGLVMMLLLVPIRVYGAGWVSGLSADGECSLGWGWGFISVSADARGAVLRVAWLPIYRPSWQQIMARSKLTPEQRAKKEEKKRRKEEKKALKARKKEPKKRRPFSLRGGLVILRFVRRLAGTIRVRGWLAGVVGLDDPADTAALLGAISPLNHRWQRFSVEITGNWTDEMLDLQGEVRVGLWPIRTALATCVLMLDREVREALFAGP